MKFSERGDIPSCSALGRIRNCGGSWALSRGVPDESNVHTEKGDDVHDILKRIIRGEFKNPQTENEQLAWRLWGHMQKAAFSLFGDNELVWRAEERIWMSNDNLEPILSGQYDALCYAKDRTEECIVFDAKTGWLSGDVPRARFNPQIQGLAVMLEESGFTNIYGSIVREWAADEPEEIFNHGLTGWVRPLAGAVHNGEYDVWHKAGLRTGEWCQFCPAKGNCPAYRDAFGLVVRSEELERINIGLNLLESQDLVRILRASPMAADVIDAAKKEAHRRRLAGQELPGVSWKRGNTTRKIKDPEAFSMKMLAEGVDLSSFQKTDVPMGASYKAWLKVKGLKDDKAGKEKFAQVFKELLEFSENSPSIEFD